MCNLIRVVKKSKLTIPSFLLDHQGRVTLKTEELSCFLLLSSTIEG